MPDLRSVVPVAATVLASVVSFALAFEHSPLRASSTSPPPRPRSESSDVGYPHARFWRDPALDRVVVDVSHVLVAHSGSSDVASWMPRRPTERSRDEARRRAIEIAERLRREPSSFAEVARVDSDDEASASLGGRIGPTVAVRLPAPLVEAFAHVGEGRISRPIETEAGFHVITWRRASIDPPRVSARQIVVAYDATPRDGEPRTRAEARILAESLRARLVERPDEFLAIAREFSDGPRASSDADWGAHSAYDPGVSPIAVRLVSSIPVGGITPVVDTPAGFVILGRSIDEPREILAASFLAHSVERPGDVEREVRGLRRAATRMATSPDAFDAERGRRCEHVLCERSSWTFRRGDLEHVELERALLELAAGEITAEPVVVDGTAFLVKRLSAPTSVDPPFRDTFPDDAAWSFEESIAKLDGPRLALFIGRFQTDVVAPLGLPADADARLTTILDSLRAALPSAPSETRIRLLDDAMREVRLALDDDSFARFESRRVAWFETLTAL